MAPHDTAPFAALVNILEAPSTAPGSIRRACAAVEECITVNRDNLQAFFQACFPVLIKRVFGYDIEASWLNIVVKVGREADAAGLMALLSPQGRLFNAIMSADADTLVHYTFPLERLPGHTQELLKTAAGRAELDRWPQYRGRITVDASGRPKTLTLRVFDYFMFWNAFYVLRGGRSLSDLDYPGGSTLMRADSQWGRSLYEMKRMGTNLITGLHGSHATALNTHPYFSLLEQYLNHFLPRSGGATGAGATSTFAAGYGGFSSKTDSSLGATLLSILVEFWLTDIAEPLPTAATALPTATTVNPPGLGGGSGGDVSMTPASPLSTPGFRAPSGAATPMAAGMGAVAGSPAVVPSSSPLRLMSYQPPSEEVLLGIKQLVRHVHVSMTRSGGGGSSAASSTGGRSSSQRVVALPAQAPGLPPWLPETPLRTATPPTIPRPGGAAGAVAVGLIGPPACPAVQAISRKVYRFIRRALAQWPLGSSSSLVPLINLWLTVLTPWGAAGGSGKQAGSGQSTGGGQGTTPGRTGSINHLSAEISQRLHLPWPSTEPSVAGSQQTGAQYAPEWRGHVLAHLPFYTLLIPRFLELIYARLSLKGDAAAGEALLLLGALAAAGPDLIKLLKEAETALNRYRESHKKRVAGPLADLVPWMYDQAVDWEAAAVAGAPTNPPMMADVQCRLFGLDNSSAAYFGAAVLRAAHTQVRPDIREALGSAMTSVLPLKDMATTQPQEPPPLQGAQGTEQYMPAGHWTGLHYKGDWMKRPICSNEVAWLVRLTVAISDRLNHVLGLDQPWRGEQEEPPETVIAQGFSWLRQHGYRISLRPLAEIQVIGWLMVAALMWQFYRWCCAAAAAV